MYPKIIVESEVAAYCESEAAAYYTILQLAPKNCGFRNIFGLIEYICIHSSNDN